MVGHGGPRQDSHFDALGGLLHDSLEGIVVLSLLENGHPRVDTIEHVVNEPAGVIPVVRAYARFWQLPGGTEAVSRLVPENWYS